MSNDAPEWTGEGTESESYESHAARVTIGGIEYIRATDAQAEQEAAVAAEREACAEIARLAADSAVEKRNQGGSKVHLAYTSMAVVIFRRIRYRALDENNDA